MCHHFPSYYSYLSLSLDAMWQSSDCTRQDQEIVILAPPHSVICDHAQATHPVSIPVSFFISVVPYDLPSTAYNALRDWIYKQTIANIFIIPYVEMGF